MLTMIANNKWYVLNTESGNLLTLKRIKEEPFFIEEVKTNIPNWQQYLPEKYGEKCTDEKFYIAFSTIDVCNSVFKSTLQE